MSCLFRVGKMGGGEQLQAFIRFTLAAAAFVAAAVAGELHQLDCLLAISLVMIACVPCPVGCAAAAAAVATAGAVAAAAGRWGLR